MTGGGDGSGGKNAGSQRCSWAHLGAGSGQGRRAEWSDITLEECGGRQAVQPAAGNCVAYATAAPHYAAVCTATSPVYGEDWGTAGAHFQMRLFSGNGEQQEGPPHGQRCSPRVDVAR